MITHKFAFPHLSRTVAASAWCDDRTKNKTMDVELAEVFAEILDKEMQKPNLGCATTGQIIAELATRVDLHYSTVFSESESKLPPCGMDRTP